MSELLLAIAFWSAAAFIAWTWAGFPLVLALRALRPRSLELRERPLPSVGLVIVVHNEASVIEAKLANIEAVEYPRDRLRVIVVSDGSDDGTNQLVAAHAGPTPVTLLPLGRVGKNAALNAGVAAIDGEILVLSDADSLLEPDALRHLVAPFCDPGVGAVAGDFRYVAADREGSGERSYWNVDRWWRRLESRAGSATSATGQLYAVRQALATPVPDGVTDDFYLSVAAIAGGQRLWFEPGAIARGPVAVDSDAEFRRKVRLIGRGFASVWGRRRLLDPRCSGFYAIQLFTHKVMRRLVGVPIAVLAASAPLLWSAHPFYRLATVLQLAFHGLALAGFALRHRRVGGAPVFALPLAFDAASLAGLLAFASFVRGDNQRGWVPDRRASRGMEAVVSATSPENA
jgi:Glycosyl transferase family 2